MEQNAGETFQLEFTLQFVGRKPQKYIWYLHGQVLENLSFKVAGKIGEDLSGELFYAKVFEFF